MYKDPEISKNPSSIIPPIILFLIFIAAIYTIYTSIKTEGFTNSFIKPLLQQLEKIVPEPSTTPVKIKNVISLTPTLRPTLKPPTPTKKPLPPCYRLNIREGEFASNKCYSKSVYDDLIYYLQRYDSANFDLQSALAFIKISCSCHVPQQCESNKASCAEDQQDKAQAETNLNNYRSIILGLIAKGR